MGSRLTTGRGLLATALGFGLAFGIHAAEAPDIGPLPAIEIDEAKAALGKRLFFDQRLSGDASIACSDCHMPENGYGSNEALSPGYPGNGHFRNAPTLINTAHKKGLGHPWNWDGRVGTNLNDMTREMLTEDYIMNMDMRIMQERAKQDPKYVEMFEAAGYGEPSNGSIRKAIPEYLKTLTSTSTRPSPTGPTPGTERQETAMRKVKSFRLPLATAAVAATSAAWMTLPFSGQALAEEAAAEGPPPLAPLGEPPIRLYQKFYDAPGDARPDWWIISQLAKKMGFDGFDWSNANEVCEESSRFSRGNRKAYHMIKVAAHKEGKTLHQKLAELGTEGIQGPTFYNYDTGELLGSVRLHDTQMTPEQVEKEGRTKGLNMVNKKMTHFNSQTGKVNLQKHPWGLYSDYWEWMSPKEDELWHTNGRVNEIWQSGFDDVERRPYVTQRWPEN